MNIVYTLPPLITPNEVVAIDTEFFGMEESKLHRPTGKFACATFVISSDPKTVYFIEEENQIDEALQRIKNAKLWVFHNAKFDLFHLRRYATIHPRPIWDTMLMEKALFSGYYQDFGLKDLARRYLDFVMDKEAREEFSTAISMTKEMIEYSALDTVATYKIFLKQDKIATPEAKHIHLDIDIPCLWAVLDFKGIRVSYDRWMNLAKENQAIANKIKEELGFNPGSSQQTLNYMKNKLGISKVTSTGNNILEKYARKYPEIEKIQQYRSSAKLASSYGEDWLNNCIEEDGKIYADWFLYGTETGRFSARNPPIQTIPARDTNAFRECFIASEGMVLIGGDYSAQEPRVLSYFSQDDNMLNIIRKGEDIHTSAARIIFEDSTIQKSDRRRKEAKALNLGLSYGLTAQGLIENTELLKEDVHLSLAEGEEIINKYFSAFPGILDYIKRQRKFAREHEYVESLEKRKIWINAYNFQWLNNAINAPIQSTSADMTKIAIINIWKHWPKHFGKFGILIQMHDELVIEIPKEYEQEGKEFLKRELESAPKFMCPNVPFIADVSSGNSWGAKGE